MKGAITNIAWSSLLAIKEHARKGEFEYLVVFTGDGQPESMVNNKHAVVENANRIIISRFPVDINLPGCYLWFEVDSDYSILNHYNQLLDPEELNFFLNYLPYALIALKAAKNRQTYSISHFAQSLDGKIATSSGHSKWIGDNENLVHAHRMRALCDGILIGGNTLKRDDPKLTVRHVTGTDPVKIILGNGDYNFGSILENDGQVIWITAGGHDVSKDGMENMKVLKLPTKEGLIDPGQILKELFETGIYSVYIEGGSFTTSHFLTSLALNEVQVYIAPEIIGSGISSFSLSGIEKIDNAIQFTDRKFITMGEGVLFKGILNSMQYGNQGTMAHIKEQKYH